MKKLGIILCCAIAIVLLSLTAGNGGLGHFSPYTLDYCTQSEVTLFRGSLPMFRSSCQPVQNELVTFLIEEGLVSPVHEKQRWESVFHWNSAWKGGYGSLYPVLVRDRKRIIEWSKADRKRARIFWSEGFRLLRSDGQAEIYAGTVILATCWRCDSIPELQRQMSEIIAHFKDLYP